MTAYVALLRGINLGPTNKIAMPALRQTAEQLEYDDVRTYINSGNLMFTSGKTRAALERELTKAITRDFGLSVDVTVRSREQLARILAANPFPDGDPAQVTIAFLVAEPPAEAQERVAAMAAAHEPFLLAGTEVYVHYTHGQGTSKLAEQFSKVIGVSSTVRNLRTVTKLAALLDR